MRLILRELKAPIIAAIALAVLIWTGNHKDNPIALYLFCGMGGIVALCLLFLMFRQWADGGDTVLGVLDIGQAIEPTRRRGAVIGYKWMNVNQQTLNFVSGNGCEWKNWTLEADAPPTMENTNGIYVCYSPDDPALRTYDDGSNLLVEVELRGQKVLHERGARGQVGHVSRILKAGPNTTITLHDGRRVNLYDYYGGR